MLPTIDFSRNEYHEFVLPKSKNKIHIRKYVTDDVYKLLLTVDDEKPIFEKYKAIFKLVKSLVKKLDLTFINDINKIDFFALLFFIRKISLGSELNLTYPCQSCGRRFKVIIDLGDESKFTYDIVKDTPVFKFSKGEIKFNNDIKFLDIIKIMEHINLEKEQDLNETTYKYFTNFLVKSFELEGKTYEIDINDNKLENGDSKLLQTIRHFLLPNEFIDLIRFVGKENNLIDFLVYTDKVNCTHCMANNEIVAEDSYFLQLNIPI